MPVKYDMVRWIAPVFALSLCTAAQAQERLEDMPRYKRYAELTSTIRSSVVPGTVISVRWADDSKSFTYRWNGKTYKYTLGTAAPVEATESSSNNSKVSKQIRRAPERGRQFDTAYSADEKHKAFVKDRNVFLSDTDGKNELQITTDGSVEKRIKNGVASWVYGEELEVREAMWFSPNSKKLAYYRFDESKVKDYYLAMDQGKVQDTLDTEAYPKAGAPNPVVEVYIYDLESKKTTKVDPHFGDAALGEYVYDIRWSPNGKELLFNRTNRKQNIMQFCAADPDTGNCRMIFEEKQLQSWAENHPDEQFLADGKRFIWSTEANGYKNYQLCDISGKLLKQLTNNTVDATRIVRVDEKAGLLFYTSSGPLNPYHRQLHRVGLDGKNDTLITAPELDHYTSLSPDGQHVVDIAQSSVDAPETRVLDANGKIETVLAKSDLTKFNQLGLKKTEVFTYLAADGKTTLYGTIQFPSDFDPTQKYPVLLSVYGGPESGGIDAGFSTPSSMTELGFLMVNLAGRGTQSRGKAFRDAVYGKLGIVEMDDQAAGIASLGSRPYVDLKRVGVFGTSYGGYSSTMLILRHPELFAVSCASSSVTDWRNYDSIYTERFMGLPWDNENKAGYEDGSAMKYAKNLTGKLMLFFGSADNNVHPSNTYQLTQAIERANKRYDLQVGTDMGHSGMNHNRMLEYFITHLILMPNRPQK